MATNSAYDFRFSENISLPEHSYQAQSGTFTLESGEASGTFEIELLQNTEWNATSTNHDSNHGEPEGNWYSVTW